MPLVMPNALLLHVCCGVCAVAVLEQLSASFSKIYLYYYNPSIYPEEEYYKRMVEVRKLLTIYPKTEFVEVAYEPKVWLDLVAGLESEPENGERCEVCYADRLNNSALKAQELGCPVFATTLTISPHKNAQVINSLGLQVAADVCGVEYVESDFKKNNGFARSIELAKKHDMYKQNYCGCCFSKDPL